MPTANAGDAGPATRADLSNWQEPPFSRWAFSHVDEIVAHADIAAPEVAWALPGGPGALDGFALKLGDDSLDLETFLEQTATDALVVLHDGRIVYETYRGEAGPHAPHILMSATKAVMGLLAGGLAERGALAVDAPVSDYVPEIADGPYRGATIRQLLDMRTGVRLDEAQTAAYDAASGWQPTPPGRPSNLHGFLAGLSGTAQAHGGPFAYISPNTDLLGWAMERATGRSMAELLSELIWRPMGAEHPALITTDSHGAARCTGGLCATARDFVRIGRLVLEHGRRGDAEVVPEGWIDDIAGGGDPEAWADGEWGPLFRFAGARLSYRAGWYIVHDSPASAFAMGIHGQNLFVDPDHGIVVAKLSSQGARIDYRAVPLTHLAVPEIVRCVLAG